MATPPDDLLFSKALQFRGKFPTKANRINELVSKDPNKRNAILQHARDTKPLLHRRVQYALEKFIQLKAERGTNRERELFSGLTVKAWVTRALAKRPLAFLTYNDCSLFVNEEGKQIQNQLKFDNIGSDSEVEPYVLQSFINYHEMQFSSLLLVSTPTFVINTGARYNNGQPAERGTYEDFGIYVGAVGARFERKFKNEYQLLLVTSEQNTAQNGYGLEGEQYNKDEFDRFAIWAELLDIKNEQGQYYIPTFEEVSKQAHSQHYIKCCGGYLNVDAYKNHMRLVYETFFCNADQRAQELGKQAFCFVVGLGLGVWNISNKQAKFVVDVILEILKSLELKNVSDVTLSWFPEEFKHLVSNHCFPNKTVYYNKADPFTKLQPLHKTKLLVCMYAWDANAFPGNEYWMGSTNALGDPAAASCSCIGELQNPLVNDYLYHSEPLLYPEPKQESTNSHLQQSS